MPRAENGLLRVPLTYQQEVVGEFRLAPAPPASPSRRPTCACWMDWRGRRASLCVRSG